MASRLEDLADQAEQMLSELDRSEEEVETILRDLRDLEDEYDQNVGGSSRPELIAVSAALADLIDGTRRFNDTISDAKGGLRAWLDAHGASGTNSPDPSGSSARSELSHRAGAQGAPSNGRDVDDAGLAPLGANMQSAYSDHPLFGMDENQQPTPQASDIQQFGLGDCWLLAALMAIADREPEQLLTRVRANEDGSFDVRIGCEG